MDDIERRQFVVGSIASGVAMAVAADARADAIRTSGDGLVAGGVHVPVSDGSLPVYAARPASGGARPIVLVIEEIFGVHDYIQDVCRRLAHAGYCAVAPELYARIGDPAKVPSIPAIIETIILKAPDARKMADLDATAAWAASNGGDGARVGVMGFCRGGRDTWLYAEHSARLRAAVAWYGPVKGQTSDIQPTTPFEAAASLKCPLLGLYGGRDDSIKPDDVEAAAVRARAAGQTVKIEVFPDAGHGFHADYRPSYVRDAAEAGWREAMAWFQHYL